MYSTVVHTAPNTTSSAHTAVPTVGLGEYLSLRGMPSSSLPLAALSLARCSGVSRLSNIERTSSGADVDAAALGLPPRRIESEWRSLRTGATSMGAIRAECLNQSP